MKAIGTLLLVLLVPGGLVIAYWLWHKNWRPELTLVEQKRAAWATEERRRA